MFKPTSRPFAALMLLTMGCQDYDLKGIEEPENTDVRIAVDPQQVIYEGTRPGDSRVEIVTIESIGTAALNLQELRLEGSGAFALLNDVTGEVLQPGDTTELEVAYTPVAEADEGLLYITSNAINFPQALVTLNGGGLYPQLTLDPSSVDFGYVTPGESTMEVVRMINSGGDSLTIDLVGASGYPFEAWADVPVTLEPGEERELEITFFPETAELFNGEGLVSSNAPGPDRVIPLRGESVDQPIAVCSVTPDEVHTLYQDAAWVGGSSYDPSGLRLTQYNWTLIDKPSGSSASIGGNSTQATRYNFVADLVGEYTGELVVVNEAGVESEPCYATLTATPAQNLWVEMYWTTRNDDMDLHLVKPGGSLQNTTDCYYANCAGRSLDWGQRGVSADDPTLDIDDIPGTGPENINIAAPEVGTFTVYVHDYPGSVYQGANDVTVNIYLGGALVWSDTRAISGENDYVPFAEIVWPDQVVNSL